MAKPVDPSSKSEVQYGAIVKSLVTTLALTALSVIAVQVIERYGNRTFTPFQKGGARLLAISVSLFVSTCLFPWHKPATLSQPSSDGSPPSESAETSSTITLQNLIGKDKTDYEWILGQINRCQETELILRIQDENKNWLNVKIYSTAQGKGAALQHCEDKIASFPSEPVRPLSVDTISPPGPSQPLPNVNLQDLPKQTKRIYQCLQKKIPTHEQPYMMVSLKTNDQSENEIVDLDLSTEEKKQAALKYCQQQLNSLTSSQPSTNEVDQVLSQQNDNADDIERVPEREVEVSVSASYQAVYKEEVHGMNGSFMRERYFDALLEEIKKGVEERIDINKTLGSCKNLENARKQETWVTWSSSTSSYLIIMLEALEPDSKRTAEERYGALVQAHRQLLYLKDNSAPCTAFVKARMTPKMQVFQESYVGEFLGKHGRKLTLANFSDEFTQRNEAVKKAPKEMKMAPTGTVSRQFCGAVNLENYYDVNPPNHLETITLKRGEKTRTIDYIRGPTPHLVRAYIEPTFEAYLKILQDKGEVFFYSAHQRLKDQKSGFSYATQCEIEDHRSQGLIELEKSHSNFLLIFQSVENDLFKKDPISIDNLKKMIKESFTDPKGRNQNRLPVLLQKDEHYKGRMDALLTLVETVFFSGVTGNLSPKDRESFILYFYALQRLDLMTGDYLGKPVAAMTTPCKDFYDRGLGQALMTRIMNLVLIYGKSGIPSAKLEEIANAGQFPPLLGKGLPAIEHRFGPACEAIEHLSKVDAIEPLREFDFNGWKVTETTVHRQEGQSALPLGE